VGNGFERFLRSLRPGNQGVDLIGEKSKAKSGKTRSSRRAHFFVGQPGHSGGLGQYADYPAQMME